ncbi:hypothetical protein [Streptomyces sp. NPDC088752]|uniref:hypothetical protein n=1 Tax=Streptomyces sp. NPDC088752 TaxID=3154963 RepID=UPI00342D79A6
MLDTYRSLANCKLHSLGRARLLFRQAKGIYRLNLMSSGYGTAAHQIAAINEMNAEDRFDIDDYQERYDEAVAEAEEQRRRRAAARGKPQNPDPGGTGRCRCRGGTRSP